MATTLTNIQTQITETELMNSAISALESQLGIWILIYGDTPVPLWPFIALGMAIYDIVSLLGGGKPVTVDTNNVIRAYNMSAYPPLHLLAADLAEMLKNGAPISDSRAKIQAQFGALKQGTVESLQSLSHAQPGPSGAGYWQFFQLIELSWKWSADYQRVFDTVRALDQLVQGISQLEAQQKPPPPPSPPPPPPPPPPPYDAEADELLQCCQQTNANLRTIIDKLGGHGKEVPNQQTDNCCTQVVLELTHVVKQLTIIASAMLDTGAPPAPAELGAIATALQQLAAAAIASPPILDAIRICICENLSAIAGALGPELGPNVKGIVDQLATMNADDLIPAAFVDAMVKNGTMPPELAQMFSDRPWHWSVTGLLSGVSKFFSGGMNPELGKEIAANIQAVKKGQAPPYQPIHSLIDVPIYLLAYVGSYWSTWAVDLAGVALPAAEEALKQIGGVVVAAIPGGAGAIPVGLGGPAIAALKYVQSAPPPNEKITVGTYQSVVQDAMGRAGAMGFTAWAAAMVGGFLLGPWEKYWGETAAMIATAAGFDEIALRWMGPFLDSVIRNRAIQDANSKWPTKVPPGPQALALWARRKISDAQGDELLGYFGMDPDWRPAMKAGAYAHISPFILASAFADMPFPTPQITDVLEDNAYSPAHVQFMLDTFRFKSLSNVRNAYVAAAIAATGKGVMGEDELTQIMTNVGYGKPAQLLVQQHALIMRREQIVTEAESQIVFMVAAGVMTPDDGLHQLETAGVQPWRAQLKITLATTRADVHAAKLAATAEKKAELARQKNLMRIAIAEYQQGNIDEAGLTAALLAI